LDKIIYKNMDLGYLMDYLEIEGGNKL